MKIAPKKFSRKKTSGLPLGLSHKEFVRTLHEEERLEVFRRFADRFWQDRSATSGRKKGFGARLKSRLELARQIAAKRVHDTAVMTSGDKLEFLFRRGFFADKWAIYDLATADPEQYLSDLQALLLFRANTIYHPVLDNRLLFGHAFGQYFRTPMAHGLKNAGEGSIALSREWETAMRGASDSPPLSVIVQPLDASARGRSAVFTIHHAAYFGSGKSGSLLQLDSVIRDWARSAHSPYLVIENVSQGTFASGLNANSVNILHVLLSRTDENWAPRIDAAILRIGTRRSGPLGRVENGGLSALVEVATGAITRCVYLDGNQQLQTARSHPDSGAQIVGLNVPGWSDIKGRLLALFDQSSYLRIAGFDLILQDDGAVLVGGTNLPDVAGIQVHQPLLRDLGFAQFMRKQRI